MKSLKLFPKTFISVTGLMLVIALIAHALIYVLMPIFYTNQKQSTIERDTDTLVALLSVLPEEEYRDTILEFRKDSDMTVMLSAERHGRKRGMANLQQQPGRRRNRKRNLCTIRH